MGIKGYKVFNPDWTCRGFKYELGKTYEHEGDIDICRAGFHFCRKASDCFNYYPFDSNNHVAEIEAIGFVESDDDKSVTDKITIIREIPWQELLTIVNEGKDCTGLCNTGNWNSGNRNSGNRNSGNGNSGNWNSGNWNSGNWNSGKWNSGNRNSGNWNSGNWNSGNRNSGFFCTDTPNVRAFNVQTGISWGEWLDIKGVKVLDWNYENNWWIYSQNMSDKEKKEHPEYKTTGGYLKTVSFKEACGMMWDRLDEEEKQAVREIPYFDVKIFEEITGIDVTAKEIQ